MDRREFFAGAAGPLLCTLALGLGSGAAHAYPNPRRRGALPARHRIRRRLLVRTHRGRIEYVVPTDLAVGWELQHAARVVLVRELQVSGPEASRIEIAIVSLLDESIERLPITRENTDENRVSLVGSLIEPDDPESPAIEDLAHECAREFA